MNTRIIYILFFIVLTFSAANSYSVEVDLPVEKNPLTGQSHDIAEQVKKTFALIKKNDGKNVQTDEERMALEKLEKLGEKVVPFLKPYLNDTSIDVRITVVNLALKIGGENSLILIASALRNSKADIQKRAAEGLYVNYYYSQNGKSLPDKTGYPFDENISYQSFSPEKIAAQSQTGIGLRESIKSGNASVSAVFLLANFPGTETENVLGSLSRKIALQSERKLSPAAKEIKLAASIILANAENKEAVRYLSETAGKSDVEPLIFLFTNITEIKSPEVLSSLTKKLDDKTFLQKRMSSQEFVKKYKLPKGSWVDQTPPRRICDLAVNSFVGKFNLKVSFVLHLTIYNENQLSEVRELVKATLNM